jgi:hypothetical protein
MYLPLGPIWLGFLNVFGALRIFEVWEKRSIPLGLGKIWKDSSKH